jgi:hypothetical protein
MFKQAHGLRDIAARLELARASCYIPTTGK